MAFNDKAIEEYGKCEQWSRGAMQIEHIFHKTFYNLFGKYDSVQFRCIFIH